MLGTRVLQELLRRLLEEWPAVGWGVVDLVVEEVCVLVFSFEEEHELFAVFVLLGQFAVFLDLRVVGLGQGVSRGNAGPEGLGLGWDFELVCEVRWRCVGFWGNNWRLFDGAIEGIFLL